MLFGEAIKAVKERISLVDVAARYCNLRQNGSRYLAPCPFHQETKPSFYVFPDRGSFYCFGCQASGDLIEFYSRINGLDFRDAVEQLAEEAGISIDGRGGCDGKREKKGALTEKQAMLAMHEAAASFYAACLADDSGAECRDYIARRGLSAAVRERFGLGWARREWRSLENFLVRQGHNPEIARAAGLLGRSSSGAFYDRFRGRLMFPIKSLANQVIAFGGRIIGDEDEAKYINSSDTPIYGKKLHLYGLAQARRGIAAKGHVLLTEGYMDVLTLHQFGFDNSAGVLGTALTEEQVGRIAGFASNVKLLFDGDGAGRKAALRAAAALLSRGLSCSVIILPDGEDIDSFLRGPGPDAFEKLCQRAPDGFEFCATALGQFAPKDAIAWAREFISQLEAPELASRYASLFALRLGFSENEFREGLRKKAARPAKAEAACEDWSGADAQIMIFLARYPEKLDVLRDLGADMVLSSQAARKLWGIVEKYGAENAVYYLDEKRKSFWLAQRGPRAPRRDNCEPELSSLKKYLETYSARAQAASLQAALASRSGDFAAGLEFLRAIRDTMRKTDEQS